MTVAPTHRVVLNTPVRAAISQRVRNNNYAVGIPPARLNLPHFLPDYVNYFTEVDLSRLERHLEHKKDRVIFDFSDLGFDSPYQTYKEMLQKFLPHKV